MMNATAYRLMLQALLPRGTAWPRSPGALLTSLLDALAQEFARLDALAQEFARLDAKAEAIAGECIPGAALELLADWERVCGLPDSCAAGVATTLQERRAAVEAKLTAQGGASKAYFMALASTLGYEIEIDEFRPFVAGLSRCGEVLNGGHAVRHQWRVRVIGPRYTAFRTGASQCGDLLGKISRAADLECKFLRLKPAHTHLIFEYQGA